VNYPSRNWNELSILMEKFKIEPRFKNELKLTINDGVLIHDVLSELEKKLEISLSERGKEQFYEMDKHVIRAVKSITRSEIEALSYGIDYNLELINNINLITEDIFPIIYYCLVTLPKIKDEGLVKENHGMGYHIHYVVSENKKKKRSNIVLTFNPTEIVKTQHILYWEHHGSGLKRKPEKFGKRRRNAIYDTSCGFLSKVSKTQFRSPVNGACILWPK
jgi:hypothetical protein